MCKCLQFYGGTPPRQAAAHKYNKLRGDTPPSRGRSQIPLGESQADLPLIAVHLALARSKHLLAHGHVAVVHLLPIMQAPAARRTSSILHGLHALGLVAQ